jgi:carbohydrate-selective porin OprB
VVSTAGFIGRPQDTLGFAASWFQVSEALTATQELEQALDEPLTGGGLLASSLGVPVGVQSHEAELEAEYTAKVYRGVFITPDIQYVINPDGMSHIRNALCVALQINATF